MMGPEEWAVIVSPVTALIGYLGGRRKNKADATKVVTDVALSLVNPLKKHINMMAKSASDHVEHFDKPLVAALKDAGIPVPEARPLFTGQLDE